MKLNSKIQIKILLLKNETKLKELARMLSEKTGKKYSLCSLSHKINRDTITYNEMLTICEVLGYEIEFKKLNNVNW